MKKLLLLTGIISITIPLAGYSQTDTLLINNEKIPCTLKEITADAVKYTFPGEDLLNTVYKNCVQKIIYQNGRIQTFSESTSFKTVNSVDEFENVTLTAVESEVKGLFKLGDVSAKAKGATSLSNQERVKERAFRKMKIEAAMMGANIIYLTHQRSEGNKSGLFQTSNTETSLTGVAYNNQLPRYEDFINLVGARKDFVTIAVNKMWSSDAGVSRTLTKKTFKIINILNDNGIVTIEGQLSGENSYNKFRLSNFTNEIFSVYYKDKSTAYNYEIKL